MTPILSIGIPAYNRPEWLKRSLESVIVDDHAELDEIEIIVSDDSSDLECRRVAEEILKKWDGNWKYIANNPRLGMAPNWNQTIHIASGKYMLILHDDDYLLPNAILKIINSIQLLNQDRAVLLFGVQIVNQNETLFKKQVFSRQEYLLPPLALKNLLNNSSFVRFPAIVISRQLFEEVGYFDTSIGGVADIDMWTRLFSKVGIHCIPMTTCAYRVHSQALTDSMFQFEVIQQLLLIFERVKTLKILSVQELSSCKSNFFHQFILAGTYRKIVQRKFGDARKIMQLFKADDLIDIKPSIKWMPVRLAFKLVTTGSFLTQAK
jgi:glycosyltransferase involved in cell wall biosynthesis